MDVNAKIAETWLREFKHMLTTTELYFGSFHNDVDILAVNMRNKEIWDCEVKVRTSTTRISDTLNKQNGFKHIVTTIKNKSRKKTIEKVLGRTGYKIAKKFITTKSFLGKTQVNREKWLKKFEKEKIEVIFFDEILDDLSDQAQGLSKTNNDVLQVLKLFHISDSKKAA